MRSLEPQDQNVNPVAPRPRSLDRPVSNSQTQNDYVQRRILELQGEGARNIRVNQQQVDIHGNRVGINRPDLQYTKDGQRFYEEFDTSSLLRATQHGPRLLNNDPAGAFRSWLVP